MTSEPTPLVTVLPCDRARANIGILTPEKVLVGQLDDHPLVQAVASARLAALEEAAKVAENMPIQIYRDEGIGAAGRSCKPATFQDVATAIRALSNKTGEGSGEEASDDLRSGIISEVMAYASINTRDAGELADQIMARMTAHPTPGDSPCK